MQLPQISFELGEYAETCDAAWKKFCDDGILARIWEKDYSVWGDKPDQISNRLGWLDCVQHYWLEVPALQALAKQVCDDGITQVVLLGMGGSSLGVGVLAKVFGPATGYPNLTVLDTTDPQAINEVVGGLDFNASLFVVSTKSGSTVETMSLFKYCFKQVGKALGYDSAGQHFVAITDPGSLLEVVAKQLAFRHVFLNDTNIGGRYSVLSYFGLVPAALMGLNLELLLDSADEMANLDRQSNASTQGGAYLGVVLGVLAKQGRDKLTVICSPKLAPFGPWLEQLIAESSGKQGKGILPILENQPCSPERYGADRMFVVMELAGERPFGDDVTKLAAAGFPVIRIPLPDIQCLGGEFFRWQMAVACMCHVTGVNPFDQPDVESAKQATRSIVESGTQLVYPECQNISETLNGLIQNIGDGGYIAVLAYLNPNRDNTQLLSQLCDTLRKLTLAPVTHGFGPGYLHSTGQLHKGGIAGGRFLIITADNSQDLAIPDEPGGDVSSLTFGSLITAQALGDEVALVDACRAVSRIHFESDPKIGMQMLLDSLINS